MTEYETTALEDAEELEAQARYLLSDANSIRIYLDIKRQLSDEQRTEIADVLGELEALAGRVEKLFDDITPEDYEADE